MQEIKKGWFIVGGCGLKKKEKTEILYCKRVKKLYKLVNFFSSSILSRR